MKHRLFIARSDSPLHAEIARLTSDRRKAIKVLRAFMKSEGCSDMYGTSPATYQFDFKSMADVDQRKWTQVKRRTNPRGWEILFRPKRNTPEGKELLARVKALPNCPSIESAINIVPGLRHRSPMFFDGSYGYYAFIRHYSHRTGLLVVSVPSPEVDAKKLSAYAKQAASSKRTRWDDCMDAALWSPPEWLSQVKEWEALRAIEQDRGAEAANG